ncbi:hypothetical protein NST21_19720 [Peribacillus sp. FSL K6-1552]|uniref:hypothetical protein n=1 Tax=Peribacillus sp. FSL K6-1552 TaxID=2954514 RepID=UPI0030FB10A9
MTDELTSLKDELFRLTDELSSLKDDCAADGRINFSQGRIVPLDGRIIFSQGRIIPLTDELTSL